MQPDGDAPLSIAQLRDDWPDRFEPRRVSRAAVGDCLAGVVVDGDAIRHRDVDRLGDLRRLRG